VRGSVTLRTPAGERVLEPWDTAILPAGEQGLHQVRNATAEPARLVFFANHTDPDVRVYPDDGLLVVAGAHAQLRAALA
jgi:uncharacterized cupin superfamily protein